MRTGPSSRLIPFLLSLILFAYGCAHLKKGIVGEEKEKRDDIGINQVFFNFPDIPIPKELELVPEKTFIYESPSVRAGVLSLKGNVDLDSLQNYFKANMSKNGWRFVNSFRYKDITMNFLKEEKTCAIRITRDGFTTHVEIAVGPVSPQLIPQR